MKNLINKIFLTGMIGLGSLVGFNGYGQDIYKKIALQTFDSNLDKIVDGYSFYYLCNNSLNILEYTDEDADGRMDNYSLRHYLNPTNKIIQANGKIEDDLSKEQHKELIKKFQYAFPSGTFSLDGGKTCDKKNIFDCLIDLF